MKRHPASLQKLKPYPAARHPREPAPGYRIHVPGSILVQVQKSAPSPDFKNGSRPRDFGLVAFYGYLEDIGYPPSDIRGYLKDSIGSYRISDIRIVLSDIRGDIRISGYRISGYSADIRISRISDIDRICDIQISDIGYPDIRYRISDIL